MNKVILIGNLARDPEARATANGVSFCQFSVAVPRTYSGNDGKKEVDFLPVVAWRSLSDNVSKYCRKGSKVAVVGQLTMRSYEDKNGNKRTVYEVLAESVEFLSSGKRDEGGNAASAGTKTATSNSLDDDGDLPF